MKITALYHAIESLKLPESLQNASAIPLQGKNGAAAVVGQQCSGTTVLLIMPYGMLLLSFSEELDATSVVYLTNFIKVLTGEQDDMMLNVDNPISSDQANALRVGELEEQEKLLYALHEIAETSEDAESVRVAFITLTTTEVGQAYMKGNPIKL